VLTTAYSMWLKKKLLLDAFLLAGLYTHRVIAGAAAAYGAVNEATVSFWLLGFCIFMFLSLAFAKRYAELTRVRKDAEAEGAAPAGSAGRSLKGRAYHVDDLGVIESVGPTSGYMAVLVLALYMNSPKVTQLYDRPFLLWLVCPLLLYWVTRVWFMARRSKMEDPILFALKDRVSLLTVAAVALLVFLAAL